MGAKTARIDLRADPARDGRIRVAAALARQSVSAFVLDPVPARAPRPGVVRHGARLISALTPPGPRRSFPHPCSKASLPRATS